MPMTRRLTAAPIAALLLILLLAVPAAAWDSFVGQESCEFVVAQMAEDDEMATLIIGAFVTGANFATGRSVSMDIDGMASWVRDYCTRHPSERFLDALVQLDAELDARQSPESGRPADREGDPKVPEAVPQAPKS